MTIQQRFTAPTPPFFKKLRNTGLAVLTIAGAILGAPVALPAILTKIAAYAAVAGTVASTVSQATVEAAVKPPKKKKKFFLLLYEFSRCLVSAIVLLQLIALACWAEFGFACSFACLVADSH